MSKRFKICLVLTALSSLIIILLFFENNNSQTDILLNSQNVIGESSQINNEIDTPPILFQRSSLDSRNYPGNGDYGFQFVRIRYDQTYYGRRGRQSWAYDWPTAEENLYMAIKRTTNLRLTGKHIVLTLADKKIFNHSILYLCEPGYWLTNDVEVKNMKEFFARGGFMIIDDFHLGEWNNFYHNIKLVFPNREPIELEPDHPIWNIYYDIDPIEAPSTKRGFGRYEDKYYGIFDDNGRMMVVICYNQDIGDGWEWPDGRLLKDASTVSFQMAINFIMYALTH